MSLREFKETLASLPFSSEETFASQHQRQARKPPKCSLREQIALIEQQTADLDSLTFPFSSENPNSRSKLSNSTELLVIDPSLKTTDAISGTGDSQKNNTPHPKRIKLSDHEQPFSRGCNGSSQETLSRPPAKTRLCDYAPALLCDPFSLELPRKEVDSKTKSLEGEHNRQPQNGHDHQQHHDEEDDFLQDSIAGDSEAGLFIQAQDDGLPEPLILWPRDGEVLEKRSIDVVQVPSSINVRLMDHQRIGVTFLFNLYRENKGGVLGDDMGLGKTIQVIAFLAAILKIDQPGLCTEKQVLIVCPTSVLRNWEQEFHSWGVFKVAIYHGVHRGSVLKRLEARNLQIVLTSFDTFRIHGECLCDIDWDCMVVDEAHRLKNDKSDLYKICTNIRTRRRYGLTGTIMQNKLMDMFNVFDWATPGCLGTREHFKEFYEEPLKQGQRISAPQRFVKIAEERKAHLGEVLKKYLLRREKHDTIGHLMMGKEDNVIFCEMSPLQRKVYKRLLHSPDFQCLIKKDAPCSCGSPLTYKECCYRVVPNGIIWQYLHKENSDGCDSCPYCLVLPCLTKLQQVSNHIELIKPNPKDDPEKQKKDQMLTEFVLGEDADLVGGVTQDESFLGLSDSQHCGKMRALELLLAHWVQEGDKVLLFSYSVRMLDILEKFMIRKGYCFSRLDGSTAMNTRQSLVDDFNCSPSKQVFLISTRAGGLGLNLVSANRVVIFDPNWNPAQDLQAQDRSFRFGQRRHVVVYRLLAAGSLEELVYTRQIYKQQLFNIAVSGNLEKRYFEGVQDSKCNQGELFGISNLFKDLTEKTFTSDIIENHEERALKYCGSSSKTNKVTITERDDNEAVEQRLTVRDKPILQRCNKTQESKERLARILKNAGVVYAHRNEDVVNCKLKKTKIDSNNSVESEPGPPVVSEVCTKEVKEATRTSQSSKVCTKEVKEAPKRNKPGQMNHKHVNSKEEQFASLANFKGMEKTQFCKWLLSVSETEKQNLLLDFKRAKRCHV